MAPSKYNGLTFEEMRNLLRQTTPVCDYAKERAETLQQIALTFDDSEINMLHLFWMVSLAFQRRPSISRVDPEKIGLARELENLGLVQVLDNRSLYNIYELTEDAKQFLLRFRLQCHITEADKLVLAAL